MGVAFNMPLTDDFVALARSPQHSNRFLERYQTPDDVFERYIPYFEDELGLELGLELVIKSSRYTRLSKMTTTYFREIRLGSRWPEYNDFQKASTLVHEAVHARQWRYYGRFRFGTWYLRRPRWRWAIEMHGYRESARWAVIHMHAAGSSTSRIEREVRRRASATTGILVNGYALGRVSRSDRMDWTNRIMLEEGYKQLELLAA